MSANSDSVSLEFQEQSPEETALMTTSETTDELKTACKKRDASEAVRMLEKLLREQNGASEGEPFWDRVGETDKRFLRSKKVLERATAGTPNYDVIKFLLRRGYGFSSEVTRDLVQELQQGQFTAVEKYLNDKLYESITSCEIDEAWELLILGASLTSKTDKREAPLDQISGEVLSGILDKSVEMDEKGQVIKLSYLPIMEYDDDSCEESTSDLVFNISCKKKLQPLLAHPVLTAFIQLKWRGVQRTFHVMLVVYFLYLLFLMFYVWHYCDDNAANENNGMVTFGVLSFLAMSCVVVIEVSEACIFGKKYFIYIEVWIIISLTALTMVILFVGFLFEVQTRKHLSAVVSILAAFEVLFLLNQCPLLGSTVIYVAMLKIVALSYIKVLLSFISLLMAFSFNFYLLSNPQLSIPSSFLEMILLFSGLSDSESKVIDKESIWNVINFLIFAFFMTTILVNLFIAVAISDMQEMQKDAKLITLRAQIYNIKGIEKFLKKLRSGKRIVKFLEKLRLGQSRSFSSYLHEMCLKFETNGRICGKNYKKKTLIKKMLSCLFITECILEKDTVEKAQEVVQARRKEKRKRDFEETVFNLNQLLREIPAQVPGHTI